MYGKFKEKDEEVEVVRGEVGERRRQEGEGGNTVIQWGVYATQVMLLSLISPLMPF